jgi:hypothetical protein
MPKVPVIGRSLRQHYQGFGGADTVSDSLMSKLELNCLDLNCQELHSDDIAPLCRFLSSKEVSKMKRFNKNNDKKMVYRFYILQMAV